MGTTNVPRENGPLARTRARLPAPRESRLLTLTKHPVFTLIIGFALTGVVGTWLTAFHSAKSRERETLANEQRLNHEFGLKTLEEFSDRYFAHWTRAEMLYQAISRRAPEAELRARKADYDQAYFELSSRFQTTLFRFRRALGSADNYANFESAVSRPVKKLRDCLTHLADRELKLQSSKQRRSSSDRQSMNPGSCETDRLLFYVTVECGNRTHDELYRVIARRPSADRNLPDSQLMNALQQIEADYCYIRDPLDYIDPQAFRLTPATKDTRLLRGF